MIALEQIYQAQQTIKDVAVHTPLLFNEQLSETYGCNISLKREDLQPVRSYKLRGAYNKVASLLHDKAAPLTKVVCASAGNHAQGVAYACSKLGIAATIFMPETTPSQKIKQVRHFGKGWVDIILVGDTFDQASKEALAFCEQTKAYFIHPFDDPLVIAGQATIGLELLNDYKQPIDYLFVPIGGGGLAAGMCSVFRALSPQTKIIGVEPMGASSMKTSIENNANTALAHIDKFVDGAAVSKVGDLTFSICREHLHQVVSVEEGQVCTTILKLYNEQALVVEPAGALSVAVLDQFRKQIKGKHVVCVISGSNNDIERTEEIKERSLLYQGLKHYFIVNFPQRPGALKEFVTEVLSQGDDITYFQFSKRNSKECGPAVVGIELKSKTDFQHIEDRLRKRKFSYRYINENDDLFTHLIG